MHNDECTTIAKLLDILTCEDFKSCSTPSKKGACLHIALLTSTEDTHSPARYFITECY